MTATEERLKRNSSSNRHCCRFGLLCIAPFSDKPSIFVDVSITILVSVESWSGIMTGTCGRLLLDSDWSCSWLFLIYPFSIYCLMLWLYPVVICGDAVSLFTTCSGLRSAISCLSANDDTFTLLEMLPRYIWFSYVIDFSRLFSVAISSILTIGVSIINDTSSSSHNCFTLPVSLSIYGWSLTEYVNFVCNTSLQFMFGLPIQVHQCGVSLAVGSPGPPLISCVEQWSSAQSRPIRMSTIGWFAVRGKSIFSRCGHRLLNPFRSITLMFPVTLFVVYAATFILPLPVTLFNSISIGLDSNVLTCPFKTLTVIVSILPLRPSSAATSSLTYVFMLASSSRALTQRTAPISQYDGNGA